MKQPSCCSVHGNNDDNGHGHSHGRFDPMLWGTMAIVTASILLHLSGLPLPAPLHHFTMAITDLMKTMWWGIVAGAIAVGLMNKVPREYFAALLGRGDTFGGLLRAAFAGLLLDLCSHGILMVGAKLYERGASLAQIMTFLISSPWNSFSLTLILIALIGLKWTLVFIAGSVVIAVFTGWVYLVLTKRGVFAKNPHAVDLPADYNLRADMKARLKTAKFDFAFFRSVAVEGVTGSAMVVRWLFLGTIIAALIRTFVSDGVMAEYFGPTLIGLLLTLAVTTVIEVCSEGSTPIAAELFARANAPGNAFTFLMAGVSTDYTEMLVIREMTKSWKVALSLPLITVPQVLLLGYILNQFAG